MGKMGTGRTFAVVRIFLPLPISKGCMVAIPTQECGRRKFLPSPWWSRAVHSPVLQHLGLNKRCSVEVKQADKLHEEHKVAPPWPVVVRPEELTTATASSLPGKCV